MKKLDLALTTTSINLNTKASLEDTFKRTVNILGGGSLKK